MKQGYKVDLHTHSIISHDGGISEVEYKNLLDNQILDYIAITDHNSIDFALEMHKKFGERVIVGEEIMTTDGEIIGLFLDKKISSGLSLEETIKQIHEQGGLVYLPHPFETVRKGIKHLILEKIKDEIDIMETFNARSFQRETKKEAKRIAQKYSYATSASSDAHGIRGIGTAYTIVAGIPTKKTLCALLKKSELVEHYVPWLALLYPKYNAVRKFVSKIAHI